MVEVLHFGKESLEFPSYSLGYVKAQALPEDNKILGRGTLEVFENSASGYYSQLLVHKLSVMSPSLSSG